MAKKLRTVVFSLGLVISLSACVYDPHVYGSAPQRYHPHYYPYHYDYYYYPGARVYFQFSTGLYFYLSNKRWIRARVLPRHIHLHPHDRIIIRVKSDKPYLKHREHVKKYRLDEPVKGKAVTPKLTAAPAVAALAVTEPAAAESQRLVISLKHSGDEKADIGPDHKNVAVGKVRASRHRRPWNSPGRSMHRNCPAARH